MWWFIATLRKNYKALILVLSACLLEADRAEPEIVSALTAFVTSNKGRSDCIEKAENVFKALLVDREISQREGNNNIKRLYRRYGDKQNILRVLPYPNVPKRKHIPC